jgi:hypothetical protein
MSHAKLDLSGINLDSIGRGARQQRQFTIPTASSGETSRTPIALVSSSNTMDFCSKQCFCVLLTISLVAWGTSAFFSSTPTHVKKLGNLRRMIRMKCQTRQLITHCTSQHGGGNYVVSLDKCEDVYEFNGIPFTDIAKDEVGNYIVPGAFDNTLRIKTGCEEIAATLDTAQVGLENYASSHSDPNAMIERVVWVSGDCYHDFTLKIGDQVVYEATPVAMIKSSKLKTKTAYIYDTDVDYLKGSISITGDGCNDPITTYIRRSI